MDIVIIDEGSMITSLLLRLVHQKIDIGYINCHVQPHGQETILLTGDDLAHHQASYDGTIAPPHSQEEPPPKTKRGMLSLLHHTSGRNRRATGQ